MEQMMHVKGESHGEGALWDMAQSAPTLATGAMSTPDVANSKFKHIVDLVLATNLLVKTLSREERVVRLSLGEKYYEKGA